MLLNTKYGFTASAKENGAVKFVRITDIQSGKINWDTVPFCECDTPAEYLLKEDDILVARTGGTVGKSFLISGKIDNAVFASYLIRLRVDRQEALPKFISYFLNSYLYWSQITDLKSGSAQPNVNAEKIKELLIPYCDLDTQAKIIDLIENDKIEDNAFVNLGNVLKKTIQDYDLIEEFDKKNSDLIDYTSRLRHAILQEAISGKLVSQDPNDEPASELLKKIEAENKLTIKKKKCGELSPISVGEIPFELPAGWAWARLGQIIQISSGDGLTSNMMNSEGKIPVFGGNGITGYHNKNNVDEPTLVIGRVGYYCGSIHLTPEKAWVTDNAFVTYFNHKQIDINFLVWLLKGTNLKENENATAQPVISGRKIYPIIIGLPPFAEQKRIVDKVDQLMKLCDELEEKIRENQKNSEFLIEAVLKEAFAS